jgi:predicted CopG family antitoxin
LDAAESALYGRLRDDAYGKGVRLEQERIPFSEVIKAVSGVKYFDSGE